MSYTPPNQPHTPPASAASSHNNMRLRGSAPTIEASSPDVGFLMGVTAATNAPPERSPRWVGGGGPPPPNWQPPPMTTMTPASFSLRQALPSLRHQHGVRSHTFLHVAQQPPWHGVGPGGVGGVAVCCTDARGTSSNCWAEPVLSLRTFADVERARVDSGGLSCGVLTAGTFANLVQDYATPNAFLPPSATALSESYLALSNMVALSIGPRNASAGSGAPYVVPLVDTFHSSSVSDAPTANALRTAYTSLSNLVSFGLLGLSNQIPGLVASASGNVLAGVRNAVSGAFSNLSCNAPPGSRGDGGRGFGGEWDGDNGGGGTWNQPDSTWEGTGWAGAWNQDVGPQTWGEVARLFCSNASWQPAASNEPPGPPSWWPWVGGGPGHRPGPHGPHRPPGPHGAGWGGQGRSDDRLVPQEVGASRWDLFGRDAIVFKFEVGGSSTFQLLNDTWLPSSDGQGRFLFGSNGATTTGAFGTGSNMAFGWYVDNAGEDVMELTADGSLWVKEGLSVGRSVTVGSNLTVNGQLSLGGQASITYSGSNVGINMPAGQAPIYSLEVLGGTYIELLNNVWIPSASDGLGRFYLASNAATVFASPGGYSWLSNASSSLAVPSSSNNVMTLDPSGNLWVAGDVSLTGKISLGLNATITYSSSNVGINLAPGELPLTSLHVKGTVYSEEGVFALSDASVKTDIEPLTDALDRLMRIRGCSYARTDLAAEAGRQVGVIAQEVEQVLPEAVHVGSDGRRSVAYGNLVALVIEAIREVTATQTAIERRLDLLEGDGIHSLLCQKNRPRPRTPAFRRATGMSSMQRGRGSAAGSAAGSGSAAAQPHPFFRKQQNTCTTQR